MELTQEQILKLQTLYRSKFGAELTDTEAKELGQHILFMVKAVFKPITTEDYEKYSGVKARDAPTP